MNKKKFEVEYVDKEDLEKKMEMCLQKEFCKYPRCTYCNTCKDNDKNKGGQHCGRCGKEFNTYSEYLEHRGKVHPEVIQQKFGKQ